MPLDVSTEEPLPKNTNHKIRPVHKNQSNCIRNNEMEYPWYRPRQLRRFSLVVCEPRDQRFGASHLRAMTHQDMQNVDQHVISRVSSQNDCRLYETLAQQDRCVLAETFHIDMPTFPRRRVAYYCHVIRAPRYKCDPDYMQLTVIRSNPFVCFELFSRLARPQHECTRIFHDAIVIIVLLVRSKISNAFIVS